jgi:hypothetical protein
MERGERRLVLYPTLSPDVGERLMASRSGLSLDRLRDESELSHRSCKWIGSGEHVDQEHLALVRSTVRTVADECGFPSKMALPVQQDFDRRLGTVLLDVLGVMPVHAAKRGMWVFLSCVVLPELARWRYDSKDFNRDRYLGGDRDVLRSRWWRAWSLGPDLSFAPKGRTPLVEDEFTSIMERPTIGYTPRLAAAVRDCIWRHEKHVGSQRPVFTRGLTRRLVSEKVFRSFDDLPDHELAEALDVMAKDVRQSIRKAAK